MARQPFHRVGPTLVMGVCNVTPDSFSGDGHGSDHLAAIAHGKELFESGCALVDVGGVSTRPGAASVDEGAELERVIEVVQALSTIGRVSIDTTSSEVARRAVEAGATMLNDVSGNLGELAGELGIGYVGMHSRGTPETMQSLTEYDDVVAEVTASILASCRRAADSGATDIYGDPGIGFAKTFSQNRVLLRATSIIAADLAQEGFGLLIGVSKKGFLGEGLQGRQYPIGERSEQSLAAAVWAMANGAAILRAHDGIDTVRAAVLVGEIGTV